MAWQRLVRPLTDYHVRLGAKPSLEGVSGAFPGTHAGILADFKRQLCGKRWQIRGYRSP